MVGACTVAAFLFFALIGVMAGAEERKPNRTWVACLGMIGAAGTIISIVGIIVGVGIWMTAPSIPIGGWE